MAKRAAEGKKTVAGRSKAGSQSASNAASVNGDEPELDAFGNPVVSDEPATSADKADEVKRLAEQMDKHGLSDRVTTGVLASLSASKDVKITSTSLVFHGKVLIADSTLELTSGRRYGLLGENGCGKSTLLKAIAKREYPIPEHVDIYLLNEGAPPSDLGALEWVLKEAENEMERLDALAEKLLEDEGPESPVLMDLYEVSRISATTSLRLFANTSLAYGGNGPLDLCHPCLAHSYRSRFQQVHNPQEDQGHVRWLENACRSRQGPVRQADPPPPR